ncbi:MAG: hypothetical protein PF444_10190 [Bacteroidales bacterium]|jgi:hypothetical protein|nr:hypothetical protein [Bacteroidales bacterium]
MNNKKHLLFALLLLLMSSCQNDSYLKGKEDKNINITFHRFEQELNTLNEKNVENEKYLLQHKYGEFFNMYNKGVVRLGDPTSPNYNANLIHFINDSIYKTVYDSVHYYFPSMKVEETKLTAAFRNYNRMFPERQIPQCYTHISGFNTPIVVGDSILSISLENYLGAEHVFYKKLGTYTYLLPRKNRENLATDAMRGWLVSEFPNPFRQDNLLNNIIQEGKILFIQQVLMPEEAPHLILGLTQENYMWCEKNELSLWQFMIEKQHLFSKKQTIIAKYLQNGPFFNFFGRGSSPLVGKYIGWKIVSSYMAKNKDISIEELLKNTNGQEILEHSGYKP